MDAAFDTVGGDTLRVSAELLAPEGRLASIADRDVVGFGGRYYWVRPDAADLAQPRATSPNRGVISVHVSETSRWSGRPRPTG